VADSFTAEPPARSLGGKIALIRGAQCVANRQTRGWHRLLADLQDCGFAIVDPATLTIGAQKHLFRNAEVVVGENGAAFANMIFGDPSRLRVHAVIADDYVTPTFNLLASALEIEFHAHIMPSTRERNALVTTLPSAKRQALIASILAQ
jgi:capsular polysaccharide biosynthesis protein